MAASQVPAPNPSALGDYLPSAVLGDRRVTDVVDLRYLLSALFNAAERCVDVAAIIAAVYCACALYRLLGLGSQVQYQASTVLLSAAAFAVLFVILLERRGGYRPDVSLLAVRETERILRVTIESSLLALLVAYFATEHISRLIVLLALVTVPIFVTVGKWELRSGQRLLRARGYGARRAVIVGAGTLGRRIYSALVRSPKFGLDPVAFVDDDPQRQGLEIYESSYQRKRAAKVLAGPVCPELLRQLKASVLVIATPGPDRDSMLRLASTAGVDTYFAREDLSGPSFWIDYAELDGIMLAHLSKGQTRIAGDLAKRVIDLVISALSLALLAPLFVLIAVLVKSTSAGPVLFRQDRVGKDGRKFSMYKFRTMHIILVLQEEGGSIERTARRLGIARSSLYNKVKRFKIATPSGRA